jgi:hypothetical protein
MKILFLLNYSASACRAHTPIANIIQNSRQLYQNPLSFLTKLNAGFQGEGIHLRSSAALLEIAFVLEQTF